MHISGGEPADPLQRITEAAVLSTKEGPIHWDKVPRRTGSPYHQDRYERSLQGLQTRDPADNKDHQSQQTIMSS